MDSSELDLAEKAGVDPDEERVEEVEEVNGKKEELEVHSSEKEETQPQEGGFVGEFKQYSDDNEKQGEDYNSWYDDEANTDPNPNKKRRFQETINQEADGTEKKKPKMIGIVPMAPVEILHDMMGTDLSYELADPIMPQVELITNQLGSHLTSPRAPACRCCSWPGSCIRTTSSSAR